MRYLLSEPYLVYVDLACKSAEESIDRKANIIESHNIYEVYIQSGFPSNNVNDKMQLGSQVSP